MGRSISERIAELEKDPKKKEALDKARAKIKLWIEEGTLEDHIQIDVVEWCPVDSVEIKGEVMTKSEYEDLNMFSKKDFEEDEDTATQAEEWKFQEWETSSSMFDH